jgi:hypothetical protein
MFRGSESTSSDEWVSATRRRDYLLMLAILLLMVPALAFGPAVLTQGPDIADAARPLSAESQGEVTVSSREWHPAIEHGLGPAGPVPGTRLGDGPSR